jgi:hypothetical protein
MITMAGQPRQEHRGQHREDREEHDKKNSTGEYRKAGAGQLGQNSWNRMETWRVWTWQLRQDRKKTGKLGCYNRDRTVRTGQPRQDSMYRRTENDSIAETEQLGQTHWTEHDSKDMTEKTEQNMTARQHNWRHDSWNRTAGTEQPGWDIQDRVTGTEQLGHDSRDRTVRKWQQGKAARTGQLGQDSHGRKAGTRQRDRTAGTGQLG